MLLNPDWIAACEAVVAEKVDPRFFAMRRLAETVCRRRGLKFRVVIGRSKFPHLVEARREIYWRCHYDLGKNYTEIGLAFDRDPSTIRHSVLRYSSTRYTAPVSMRADRSEARWTA